LLIADDPALDRYLLDIHGKNFASHVESGGVDLATWLASGEDADERSFQDAQRLGLPLLRLPDVAVDSATAALLPPQQARRLRVVPMRLHNGLLAVAMEDPTNAEALAAVEFATTRHVLPLVATGRGIREAIARCYDQVEDRETVRKLGLDPLATVADNEAEARKFAAELEVKGKKLEAALKDLSAPLGTVDRAATSAEGTSTEAGSGSGCTCAGGWRNRMAATCASGRPSPGWRSRSSCRCRTPSRGSSPCP